MANNFQRHFQHLLPIITDLDAEGGNNATNQSMGVSNPTIYKFTENLQLYNSEAKTQLLQHDTRLSNPRRPTRNP